jgi:hypothetical protein
MSLFVLNIQILSHMKRIFLLLLPVAVIVLSNSCKKHEDPVTYYSTNFTIKGTAYQYKTTSSFGRLCLLSGNCNTFYADPVLMQGSTLMIGLPGDVYTGMNIKSGDANWQIIYYDATGRGFFSSRYDSVNIHIDEWQGHGGWGKGTFSVKLRYTSMTPPYADSLTITNGTFSSRIWYYFR